MDGPGAGRRRKAWDWLQLGVLTALLGLGSGWAGAATRDSLQDVKIEEQQEDLQELRDELQGELAKLSAGMTAAFAEYRVMLQRVDGRVAEMYCDGKPPGCR